MIEPDTAILNGEIVAVNLQGQPSFQILRNRSAKSRGEFPSMQRIRKELQDPCWMLEKWVRIEWKRIAEEFGPAK